MLTRGCLLVLVPVHSSPLKYDWLRLNHLLLGAHRWASFKRPIAKCHFQYLRNYYYFCCWRSEGPAIGSLQLSVATSLFFCGCGDALHKANRRFKPYSRLLLSALSSFHFFSLFSAPAGPSGGRTGHTTRAQLRRITSLCT